LSEQPQEKSTMGMQPNVAGLLCYLFGWITGIIFYLLEKENKTVRFHAMQSIVVFGAFTVADIIFNIIPVIGTVIAAILGIAAFILWLYLMIKTYQGKKIVLPVAGKFAEQHS